MKPYLTTHLQQYDQQLKKLKNMCGGIHLALYLRTTLGIDQLRKLVSAINLETGKVLRFESQSEAARQLGIPKEHINGVIKGRQYKTGGYLS